MWEKRSRESSIGCLRIPNKTIGLDVWSNKKKIVFFCIDKTHIVIF